VTPRVLLLLSAVIACQENHSHEPIPRWSPPTTGHVTIPGGRFLGTPGRCLPNRDLDVVDLDSSYAITPVDLDAFAIDRHRVLDEDYQHCIKAGACLANDIDPERIEMHKGELAIATLAAAKSYCAWRGMRLPTFLEWQRAARGIDGQVYPRGWPSGSYSCEYSLFAGSGPTDKCVFASRDGMQYVMHSFSEWTSDTGCTSKRGDDNAEPIMIRLLDSRLDVSEGAAPTSLGAFRCVLAK
jgi:hypothetical protein